MTAVTALFPEIDVRANLIPPDATLADIAELAREIESDEHVHDRTILASALAFDSNMGLLTEPSNPLAAPLQLERRVWSQLGTKTGRAFWGTETEASAPIKVWLREYENGDGDVAAESINRTLKRTTGDWKVRGYDGSVRAILDAGYPAIANHEVVEMVQAVVEQTKGRLPGLHLDRSYLNRDTLYLRVAFSGKDTPDGPAERFTLFTNGNVGDKSLAALAGIKRTQCDNSIVFAYERKINTVAMSLAELVNGDNNEDFIGMSLAHSSGGEARRRRMLDLLAQAVVKSFKASNEMIDLLIGAYHVDLSDYDFAKVIDSLCEVHGWTGEVPDRIKLAGGNPTGLAPNVQSLGELVNRVTFAAARLPDYETGLEMEVLAGNLLVGGRYEVDRLMEAGATRRRR